MSPTRSEKGPPQQGQSTTAMAEVVILEIETSRYIYNACNLLYVFGTACLVSMEVM